MGLMVSGLMSYLRLGGGYGSLFEDEELGDVDQGKDHGYSPEMKCFWAIDAMTVSLIPESSGNLLTSFSTKL
jgi:hypothetical protein